MNEAFHPGHAIRLPFLNRLTSAGQDNQISEILVASMLDFNGDLVSGQKCLRDTGLFNKDKKQKRMFSRNIGAREKSDLCFRPRLRLL